MRSQIRRSRTTVVGVLAAAGVVATLSACDEARSGGSTPQVEESVVDEASLAGAVDGELIFNQLCVACHTMEPPPKLAPPMQGILGHYREVYADRDEGIAAIVAWVKAPSAEESKLEPMAIERFGLMAPLPLPEATLHAVASWVWDAYDPEADPHGNMGAGGDVP